MRASKNGQYDHGKDDDQQLDERIDALFDLLVAAGSESTDNKALENVSHVFSSLGMSDLPDEAQPYDRHMERLVAVLETCRSVEECDDLPPPIRTPPRIPSQEPPPVSSPQLQEHIDEYNSSAYPKIGPGYSDALSVHSDLTTPTVMTSMEVSMEEMDYPSYYRLRGAAAQRRRMVHQATLGRLGENAAGVGDVPATRPKTRSYPLLTTTPNAFPSVFPSDELSDSLPHSPRRQATTSLLRKEKDKSKRNKASSNTRLKKRNGQANGNGELGDMGGHMLSELSASEERGGDRSSESAKVKHTGALTNVAHAFKADTGDTSRLRQEQSRLTWSSNYNGTLAVTTQAAPKKSEPVLIDEDGFIIFESNDNEEEEEDVFQRTIPVPPERNLVPPKTESKSLWKKSERSREASATRSSRRDRKSPSSTRRSSNSRSRHTRSNSNQGRQHSRSSHDYGSRSRGTSRASRHASQSRSRTRSDSRKVKKDTSPETATTVNTDQHTLRINGVEAATKERLKHLRQMVHSSKSHEESVNNKLDFVEAETMKQIARLRSRIGDDPQSVVL